MMFIYAIVPGNDVILKALKILHLYIDEMICASLIVWNQHRKMQQPELKTGLFQCSKEQHLPG